MMKQASEFLEDIEAQINPRKFRISMWFFIKIWERVYD
jgi:hypothetical protein